MALQSLDIKRRSATTTPMPSVREPVGGEAGRLHGMERYAGRNRSQRRGV